MYISALVLVFFGVLSITGINLTQRFIVRDKKQVLTPLESLFATFVVAAPFFWLAYLVGIDCGTTTYNPNVRIFWTAVLGTTVIGIFIQYADTKSREIGEASLVAPVSAMTPGLVTISSIVVREFPGLQGILGVIAIMIGNYLHALGEAVSQRKNWLRPFRLLILPANFRELSPENQAMVSNRARSLRWAYASAVCGTGGLLFDGLLARNGNVALGFTIYATSLAGVFGLMLLRKNSGDFSGFFSKVWLRPFPIFLLGFFWALHALFIMTAFRLAPIAYIGSLKRLAIVLTVLLAGPILGEKDARRRLWPAMVITAGAMLLALDSTAGRMVARAEQLFR